MFTIILGPNSTHSSCLAEQSFLMSARTDDVRQRQMGSEKFGSLQRLCAVYHDGRLEAAQEDWIDIDANFDIGMDAEC